MADQTLTAKRTEHTPAPWHNERPRPESRTASAVICGAPPSCFPHIAYIPTNGYAASLDEQAANARLIAAAPNLLATLKAFVERYTQLVNCGDCGNWDPETDAEVIAARTAIAKAEGQARS
jgi:hypothetical protein